jgi:hypothetical protein
MTPSKENCRKAREELGKIVYYDHYSSQLRIREESFEFLSSFLTLVEKRLPTEETLKKDLERRKRNKR